MCNNKFDNILHTGIILTATLVVNVKHSHLMRVHVFSKCDRFRIADPTVMTLFYQLLSTLNN